MSKLSIVMKILRKRKKITANQLALYLKISPSYLSMIEKGQRQVSDDFIYKIIDYFELNAPQNAKEKRVFFEVINKSQDEESVKQSLIREQQKIVISLVSDVFFGLLIKSSITKEEAIDKIREYVFNAVNIVEKKRYVEGSLI